MKFRLSHSFKPKLVTLLLICFILIFLGFALKRTRTMTSQIIHFPYASYLTTNTVNIFPINGRKDEQFKSGTLPTIIGNPIKIFVHDNSDNISRNILNGQSWKLHIIKPLQKYIKQQPDLHFIDIGANVGAYALSIAALGRQVVAADGNRDNLIRLAQSVRYNHFTSRFTLVHNAVEGHRSTAITVDDLLPHIPFKRAVLKLNMEDRDGPVLTKCAGLFDKVDVPLIVLEWGPKQKDHPEDVKLLLEFMKSRGYSPFTAVESTQPLSNDYTKWPWDIVWKQTETTTQHNKHISKIANSRIVTFTSPVVNDNFNKYNLRTDAGNLIIYGYDSRDYITRTIQQTGKWEPTMMASMTKVLKEHQPCGLLDVGTNIGVYALLAAKLGFRAVGVDANIQNILRVRKSLLGNNLEDKVDLVWNAIDNQYTTVRLQLVGGNVGGSFIVSMDDKDGTRGTNVETITLDDLVKVLPFKKAIMKYDIEGKEYDALHNASKLFEKIEIPIVFMEWGVIKRDYPKYGGIKIPTFIINFFQSRNYIPSASPSPIPLKKDFHTWPWDIVWVKKNPSKT